MREYISVALPELNPEVQKLQKEAGKSSWLRSDFSHIGSTQNGYLAREWNTSDFADQIKYLKTEDNTIFYLRTILQDPKMRDLFVKELNVSPDEFWENSYEREEQPSLKREEYMDKHFWKALAVEADVCEILKNLPDKFLLETLKVYNQEIERIRLETLKQVKEMRQDFVPNFKDFTQRHELNVNWPEIENRFENINYDFFDEYKNKSNSAKEKTKAGDYSKNIHLVRTEISPFSRVDFGTLQHEHLHAISGRKNVINLISYQEVFGDEVLMTRSVPRLGASFDRVKSHPERFNWLNEAITEDINIDIKKKVLPEDKQHAIDWAYREERELFKLILVNGEQEIPARLFYQAYFESDTENPKDLKHRQELYEAISKAYGSPRFLVELDDMIKEVGIEKATEIFKSSGRQGIKKWWEENFLGKAA